MGPLLDEEKLDGALRAIPTKHCAPPPALIFESLRYGGPGDVAVVIIGQDPYPTEGGRRASASRCRGAGASPIR